MDGGHGLPPLPPPPFPDNNQCPSPSVWRHRLWYVPALPTPHSLASIGNTEVSIDHTTPPMGSSNSSVSRSCKSGCNGRGIDSPIFPSQPRSSTRPTACGADENQNVTPNGTTPGGSTQASDAEGGDAAGSSSESEEYDEYDDMCPICHDTMHSAVELLPCGHHYCGACMLRWRDQRPHDVRCPLDRVPTVAIRPAPQYREALRRRYDQHVDASVESQLDHQLLLQN